MRVEIFGTTDEIVEFFREMTGKNISNYNLVNDVKEDMEKSFTDAINRQT